MRRWRSVPIGVSCVAVVGLIFLTIPIVGLLLAVPWTDLVDQIVSERIRKALATSAVVSVGSAGIALLFGVPLAFVLARVEFPGRRLVRSIAVLPIVLPPVVSGVALLSAYGRRGFAGQWLDATLGVELPFTTTGAIFAGSFIAMPFVVITVESSLRLLGTDADQAAESLGASSWTIFRRVTVPLVMPSIGAAALLAWARALGEFGATITFAGNVSGETQTMPLAIFLALQESPASAVAVSVVLLAVSLVVLVSLRDHWFPVTT